MNRTGSVAARLPKSERRDLAVRALARTESITDIAAEHGVSRKFVYEQKGKASSALNEAFATGVSDEEGLFELKGGVSANPIFSGSPAQYAYCLVQPAGQIDLAGHHQREGEHQPYRRHAGLEGNDPGHARAQAVHLRCGPYASGSLRVRQVGSQHLRPALPARPETAVQRARLAEPHRVVSPVALAHQLDRLRGPWPSSAASPPQSPLGAAGGLSWTSVFGAPFLGLEARSIHRVSTGNPICANRFATASR